jgi:hypothetical protein
MTLFGHFRSASICTCVPRYYAYTALPSTLLTFSVLAVRYSELAAVQFNEAILA